eukprot:6676728-Prymnesium_polylepis.1
MWSGGLCGPEGRRCEPRLRRASEQAHPAPLKQWQGHGRRWRAVRVHVPCCVSRGAAVQERRGECVRAASWVG